MDATKAFAGIGEAVLQARERAGVREEMIDGVPCCAKCHEKLWLELRFDGFMAEKLGKTRLVPRNCECMRMMFAAEDAETERAKRLEEAERSRRTGIISDKCRETTFAKDDGRNPKLRRTCDRYVSKWPEMYDGNFGLAFIGSNEGGKTFWASCIANALIDSGVSVLMTTLPQLISEMTENFGEGREATLNKIRRVQCLILDDFGFERDSSFSMEKAFEIVDTRYNAERPLIITANLTEETLKNPPTMNHSRIYSRITEMCPAIIKIEGKYRQELAAKKRKELADLLRGDD